MGRCEMWEGDEVAMWEKLEGNEVARWERWDGNEVTRQERREGNELTRCESGEVGRWEVFLSEKKLIITLTLQITIGTFIHQASIQFGRFDC